MAVEILPFDIVDELHDDEALAIYLDEALATGDPAHFADALGEVAKTMIVSGGINLKRESWSQPSLRT